METQLQFSFTQEWTTKAERLYAKIKNLSARIKDLEAEAEYYELRGDEECAAPLRDQWSKAHDLLIVYLDVYYNLREPEDVRKRRNTIVQGS